MKKMRWAACMLLTIGCAAAQAGALYKCEAGGKVTYQGTPCPGGKALKAPPEPERVTPPPKPSTPVPAPNAVKPMDDAEKRRIVKGFRCPSAKRDLEMAEMTYRLAPNPATKMSVETMRMNYGLECE